MDKVMHVQEADWQGLESSAKPVFLDFWADWCGPCKMLGPTFERLADQYGEKVTFAKVNVDELPNIANQFSIRSIPTLVLLEKGAVVEKIVGLRSEQELAKVLSRYGNGNGSESKKAQVFSGEMPTCRPALHEPSLRGRLNRHLNKKRGRR